MDAYKIGIAIAMTSNASAVLGVIQKDLFGLHKAVDMTSGKLNMMKVAAGGAMLAIAGGAALVGLFKLVEAAKDLNKELNRTKQLGGDFANVGPARQAAIATSISVPTSLPSQNVRLQREIGTQIGHPEDAAKILEMVAKAAYVASNYTGEGVEDIIKNLTKVADLRGQIFGIGADGKEHVDTGKLQNEIEAAVKGLILGGGFIKSSDMVALAKQAGVPGKLMTPAVFYTDMVEGAVSLGASREGTALTSLFAQFAGGVMTKRVAEEMERIGLLKKNEFHIGRGGAITMEKSATDRLGKAATDPLKFVNDQLMPMLAAKGIVGKDALLEVFKLFGRQTTQRLIAELITNNPQFERAREITGGIPGIEQQYKMLQNEDLDTNLKSLTAGFHGLLEVLGEAGIPATIEILHRLTGAIHDFTAWAAVHPETIGVIEKLGGAVAAFAVVIGTGAVMAAAITALGVLAAPTGLLALAAGIAALGAAFPKIPSWMIDLAKGAALGAAAGSVVPVVGTGVGAVAGAVTSLVGGQINNFDGHISPADSDLMRRRNLAAKLNPSGHFAPPPAMNQNTPVNITGDVKLDGKKVGTWMGQQVGNTQSGVTGFDSRMTPMPTGATP